MACWPALSLLEPVWSALSDLFLDTETRWFLPRTAWAGARSGLSWQQLDQVYQNQVAPVVAPNLLDIAGDWAGFPDEWLFSQIRAHGDKGPTPVSAQVTAELADLWQAAQRFYVLLSGSTEEEFLLLESLAELALEEDWLKCPRVFSHLQRMSAQPWAQLCTAQQNVQEIYRPLLKYPGDPGPAQALKQWRWFESFYSWLQIGSRRELVGFMSPLQQLYCHADLSQHPSVLLLRQGPRELVEFLKGPLALLFAAPELGLRNWERYVSGH